MPSILETEITYLKGVGPKRAGLLASEAGIYTFSDLLYYFPYKHIDRSKIHNISDLRPGMQHVQVKGYIEGFYPEGAGKAKRLSALFKDETGTIKLVWFKGYRWITDRYNINKEYIVFGKPTLFNEMINIVHPEIEDSAEKATQVGSGIIGQYSLTEKLRSNYISSKTFYKLVSSLFSQFKFRLNDTLPDWLTKKYNLMPLHDAVFTMHFPGNQRELEKARYRLKFEELFYIQLALYRYKSRRKQLTKGLVFPIVGEYFNSFYSKNLPFELTGAQKKVIREIRKDLGSGQQMNRLLQGDVGSGKTLVALMSMLIAVDNDYQACLMAPTEILAYQHFNTITKMLAGLNIEVRLLTGSTRKSERTEIATCLEDGTLSILVGTHALIEDYVIFTRLGLVIIDEQHRFGVAQRARLWEKSEHPPHVLIMTATPIPRTLAMTLYGDLDVSVIDELPPGRKPVMTLHYSDPARPRVFAFMKEQIRKGSQIYIVYPLIKDSEKMDYKNLEEGVEAISRAFPPPEFSVAVVHGKMKTEEKDASMRLFKKGITNILIATTVIEVGVDVPNASVMIIESSERFGLSQLHQLRGRVGRGANQSYCILMTADKLGDEARRRIEIMTSTTDGFEIAEADLQIRGPGDMEGTQQSGIGFDLRIANLGSDGQLLEYVRRIAAEIIDGDCDLSEERNKILRTQLDLKKSDSKDWSRIS